METKMKNNDVFPVTSRILPLHMLPVTASYDHPCDRPNGHDNPCRLPRDLRAGTLRGMASGRITMKGRI